MCHDSVQLRGRQVGVEKGTDNTAAFEGHGGVECVTEHRQWCRGRSRNTGIGAAGRSFWRQEVHDFGMMSR